ncbi:hypothetical protein D3C85_1129900 [compost metagenome]
MRGDPATALQQQPSRGRIERRDPAITVPGKQVLWLTVDVAGQGVCTQHPQVLSAVHEVSIFNVVGTLDDHLPDQMLAASIIGRAHRRDIQHRQDLAVWGKYRRCRAGIADERCAKMVLLVHGDWHFVDQHGADSRCTFFAFRPAGTHVHARAPVLAAQG